MKFRLLLPALLASILSANAQQINNLDDIAFHVKNIDNNNAVKRYQSSFRLHDTANNLKSYHYEYTADSLTGNLIKAIIKDDRFSVTRTYYFVNERLIKLYEKRINPNGMATSRSSFFRDDTYSITNTGRSEMYDSEGTLHIDNSEILARKIVNPSYVQVEPKRKSALEDAYILLLNFRNVRNKNN
jgi:hypothetical protein